MQHSARGFVLGLVAAAALGSSAAAAIQPDTQVRFAAFRGSDGLVLRDVGGWPAGAGGDGAVAVSWDDGALRLTFTPAGRAPVRSDVFARIDGRRTALVLGPAVETTLDVRGVYRAELRDAQGTPVGWLRVSVSPFDAPPRVYEGSVPSTVGPLMVTAALAHLDREIDWIEAHAADVNLGS